ncbi:hypothetical protein [Lactovum odontotermitis]
MKYYIVGRVGSGKSTLAVEMSRILGIPVYHLDEFVHKNGFWVENRQFQTSRRRNIAAFSGNSGAG